MRRRSARSVAVLVACVAAFGAGETLGGDAALGRGRSGAAAGCAGSSGATVVSYGLSLVRSGRELSQTNIPVCVTGGLTVSFPSTTAGCATQGLCGYMGTESWRPQGYGVLNVLAYLQQHHRQYSLRLLLGQNDPVIGAVQRSSPAGRIAQCRDASHSPPGFLAPQVRKGQLTVRLDDTQSPLLGTRCAGPLDVDLGQAPPAVTLGLAGVLHGHAAIDLSGVHAFSSRDFAGMVTSDLRLALGAPRTSGPPRYTPGTGLLTRIVSNGYRLQRLRGQIAVKVRASSDITACRALDACRVAGAINLATRSAAGGGVYLSASGPASRPYRDFLDALGQSTPGNRRGLVVVGGGQALVHGSVTALLRSPRRCADTTRLFADQLQMQSHAGRLRVSLTVAGAQASDPLRTRCPGPAAGYHPLATATLPLSVLTRRTFTVAPHGLAFTMRPYRLTTTSTIRLTLHRTRQPTQTFRVPAPPSTAPG